jgi:hypothetical protein
MGKVKVTIDKNKEYKAVEKQSTSEIIYLEKPVETIIEKVVEVSSACQCKCEKAKPDTKLRNYAKALRKELLNKAENKSIELLNKRMDLQAIDLDSVVEDINALHDKSDILKLEKELIKVNHHLDLIDQDLKVKPVSIKTEKVVHTFDHKLVLFNILMLFLNVVFLLQILSN